MTGDETFQRQNVGSASIYGLEVSSWKRLGADSPYSVEASVEVVEGRQYDARITDPATLAVSIEDVHFRRIPPVHGLVAFRFELESPWNGIDRAELEYSWALEQSDLHPEDELDPRIDPDGSDGWQVVNLDLGGSFGAGAGTSWTLGLHNLFDDRYRIHASGFGLVVGLHYSR